MSPAELRNKYNSLQLKYFALTEKSNKRVGDLRAFIGSKAFLKKKELLEQGNDEYHSHIKGFSDALIATEKALSGDFTAELNSVIKKWRSFQKNTEFSTSKSKKSIIDFPLKGRPENSGSFSVVSLFSGAMGLDLGFMANDFQVVVANDIEENSKNTVQNNLPKIPFLHKDFTEVEVEELLSAAEIKPGDIDVLAGGPPCQPFSTAGKRDALNDPRSSPLKGFIKSIKKLKPKAFVMEEVSGLKSARLKTPVADKDNPTPEEQKGSVFKVILEMLDETGYNYTYSVVNAADYGASQKRKRLVFIGLREGQPELPEPTHTNSLQNKTDINNKRKPWNSFWSATADLDDEEHEFLDFSATRSGYMEGVPPGGHWRHLPENMIEDAMGGAYNSGGGRMGYFRRVVWDEPSPTVVTSPHQKSTMLGHPEKLRPLSLQEYKRVQGFPDEWELSGSLSGRYRLVGDAVPVHLSNAIARKVQELLSE